jgi:signal transduction histidine kinase
MGRSDSRIDVRAAPVSAALRGWTAASAEHYDRVVRKLNVLGALAAGFAVVFGLWLLWGFQLVLSFRQMEQQASDVHDSYVRGEQTLAKVRTNVLLGSIYLRDAIIDSASPQPDYYRDQFIRLRSDLEQVLRAYVPAVASSAEREHWARLQMELDNYWASRDVGLSDEARSPAEAAELLRSRFVPKRDTVLEIVDQLTALQNFADQQHRLEADALYRQARTRLVSIGAVIIVVALLVAVIASRHVNGLQRQIERQRLAEQQNREDLERLSARLVGVQEDERRHLARELHDEVGQALTAMKMDIGIALRADTEPRVKDALHDAREIAETTLRSVRNLSQLLHPSVLDDFGLPATLTTYMRNFSQRTGIRAQLAETIDDRLSPAAEVGVYRIVQEALNNVAQHSGATACTVSLSAGVATLQLVIEDNGRGLGAAAATHSARRGLGLIGMRERAQALGGTFVISNRAGGGTRIAVTLPSKPALEPVEEREPRLAG